MSTRSALEANRAGYEVGTRTIVDVLDAERNVYLAERNYAAARYSYVTNYLTLRQAAGQLSEADMVEINGWLGPPRPTAGDPAAPLIPETAKAGGLKSGDGNAKAAPSAPAPAAAPPPANKRPSKAANDKAAEPAASSGKLPAHGSK